MRVILFLLKCLVGLFATLGFLMVAAVVAGVVLWRQGGGLERFTEQVPETTVLSLDLSQGLLEAKPDNPLARVSLRDTMDMRQFLEALEAAGRDPKVKGLVARLGRGSLGVAQIQELRDAIAAFHGQGKFAVAFAESFGEGGNGTLHYYLASAFQEVWLQPSGDLDMTGLVFESPFLRTALGKLGIEPRVDQREEYKGAMSALTDSQMPEPQRQNMQRLADAWIGQIARGVAESRGLTPEDVLKLIDQAPFDGEAALGHGLVDRLAYWDQVADAVLDQAGDTSELLALADYEQNREKPEAEGAVVALIYGLGPVVLDQGENDPVFGRVVMGADTVAAAIADAVEDSEVEAIVFRVDSPGGSYVASDAIWREMQKAREAGMPVIVSMSNLAASGGYFVAAPAHKIVAQPGTVTGSIGVVAGKLVLSGLWDKLSINWDGVQAGANANFWSMNQDFSPETWAKLQRFLDRTYEDFTGKVAQGRGLDRDQVLQVAKGQIWSGEDALKLGLVDELGGLDRAFELALDAAGLPADAAHQVQVFPERPDPIEQLLRDALGGNIEGLGAGALVRALARVTRAVLPLVEAWEQIGADPRSRVVQAPELRPIP
jgi:protease-4